MRVCLNVQNLTVATNNESAPLVKNVSFVVEEGHNTALIGESGAGKTITVLALLNLLPRQRYTIQSGQVFFKGQDLLKISKEEIRRVRGRDIGFVFQNPGNTLNPLMTIFKQLSEAVYLHQQLTREEIKEKIFQLLKKVHLTRHVLPKYPHTLSGGEKQRILIAMAIANKPKLLIADEPTSSLDLLVRQEIMTLLSSLSSELNMSMLLISHDDSVIAKLAHRVYFIDSGKIAPPPRYAMEVTPSPKFEGVHTTPPLLSLEEVDVFVTKKEGEKDLIVQGASLRVSAGESLGIAGETGAGKTSVALAIMGVMPHDGQLSFCGAGSAKLRSETHYVFQNPIASFNPKFSVRSIFDETLRTTHTSRKDFSNTIIDVLRDVGLDISILRHYPDELSGGQAQRIAIAQALLRKTKLIIFDEPTASLDKRAKNGIIKLLRVLQDTRGCAYIVISHDLFVLRALCHRIAVMRQGRIVEISEADDIFLAPKTFYTRELIGHFKGIE